VARYRNTLITYLKQVEESGQELVWSNKELYKVNEDGYGPNGKVKRGIIVTGGDGVSLGDHSSRVLPRLDS
jgi:hypothetical protein